MSTSEMQSQSLATERSWAVATWLLPVSAACTVWLVIAVEALVGATGHAPGFIATVPLLLLGGLLARSRGRRGGFGVALCGGAAAVTVGLVVTVLR